MIEPNKYQLAEREITLIYFRYDGLSIEELMKSNLVSDIDAYLKKWSKKICVTKENRRDLNEKIRAIKRTNDSSQEDIVSVYREYLDIIFRTSIAINALSINQMADKICSKIVDGIEMYYHNHYDYQSY